MAKRQTKAKFKMDKKIFITTLKSTSEKPAGKNDWRSFLIALWGALTTGDNNKTSVTEVVGKLTGAEKNEAILEYLSPKAHSKFNQIFSGLRNHAKKNSMNDMETGVQLTNIEAIKKKYKPDGFKFNWSSKASDKFDNADILEMLTL